MKKKKHLQFPGVIHTPSFILAILDTDNTQGLLITPPFSTRTFVVICLAQTYNCTNLQHRCSTYSPLGISVTSFMTLIKPGIVTACWRVWHFSPQDIDTAAQTQHKSSHSLCTCRMWSSWSHMNTTLDTENNPRNPGKKQWQYHYHLWKTACFPNE